MNIRYLNNVDYNVVIQPGQLEYQLVQNNIQTLLRAELVAQEEIYAILNQYYNLPLEFTTTAPWNYFATYSVAQRVILDYATFSETNTYNQGDCVIVPNINDYDNSNYNLIGEAYCLTGAPSVGPTTSTPNDLPLLWTDIGEQFKFYNVSYPDPLFNYLLFYQMGDVVYYGSQTWSAVISTPVPSLTWADQFVTIGAVPRNVFPTDVANNQDSFWLPSGMTYSVPANTLPTDTNYWSVGDNRSQLLVMHYTEIALYYLHKNIQPTNIPELRKDGYKNAIKYFEDLAFGRKNSPLVPIQPQQGMSIRFGGNVLKGGTIW